MAENTTNDATLTTTVATNHWMSGHNIRLTAFYLGVPIVVATYGALNNWELLERAGYLATLAFYGGHALIPWWITCACTSLAMWGLRPIKPPPSALMAIGALAGAVVSLPYTNWLTSIGGAEWQNANLTRQIAPVFSTEFWSYALRATIVWFGVNFVFDRFLGLPRYRYVIPREYDFRVPRETPDAGDSAKNIRLPAFAERIPARISVDEILAIKAEQHYIRVFTPQQEYMVLYRFSDAVRELDPQLGWQVHRSYWVSKAAIDAVRPSAKKFTIRMTTGATIPVSTPHHGVVKEFARVNQIPIR